MRRVARRETLRAHDQACESGTTSRRNPPAVCYCGRALAVIGRDEETGEPVSAKNASVLVDEDGHAHFGGVQTCESTWLCPRCAARIGHDHRDRQRRLAEAHMAAGGHVAFVTLALPHGPDDSLKDLWSGLLASFRSATDGRPWKRVADAAGYLGRSRAVEVRWARPTADGRRGGWHPHMHVLVYCTGDADQTRELGQLMATRFAAAARRRGYAAHDAVQDVRLCDDASEAARYAAKGGAADLAGELTGGAVKVTRGRSIAALQILSAIAQGGDAAKIRDLRAAWDEYVATAPGRHAIHTTPSLYEHYGIEDDDGDDDSAEIGTLSPYALATLYDRDLLADLLRYSEQHPSEDAWRLHVAPWVDAWVRVAQREAEQARPKPSPPPPRSRPADADTFFRSLARGASHSEAWARAMWSA